MPARITITTLVATTGTYSLIMHLDRYATEQMCRDYLAQARWNGNPQCPKCGNNKLNYYLEKRNVYKCAKCYKQFSLIKGTIFEKSKIPLKIWFLAIYIFTSRKRGVSSIQLGKDLGVKQQTAWYILRRLREAAKDESQIKLFGIVEADETFIAPKISRDKRLQAKMMKHEAEQDLIHGKTRQKRYREGVKFKRGRKKGSTKEVLAQKRLERNGEPYKSHQDSGRTPFEKGIVVLGMIERGGRVVLKNIGEQKRCVAKDNVEPLLRRHIDKNATFVSDEHHVYNRTALLFAEHLTVNHSEGYVVDGIHSNGIENVWNHLKRMIDGTYFHFSFHHAEGYLNESSYRWNRQKASEKELFDEFIPLIMGKRIKYKDIKNKKWKLSA